MKCLFQSRQEKKQNQNATVMKIVIVFVFGRREGERRRDEEV
jgi:hypothetical protein